MIDQLAEQAAPVVREVGAKAAELAARAAEVAAAAAERAGPLAHRAADWVEEAGPVVAGRTRQLAEELRRTARSAGEGRGESEGPRGEGSD
jgi:hypothetical protein